MRKLILSMMVSLDGFIAKPDGALDWFLAGDDFENELLGLLNNVDGMLFGRVSYELLADYWPSSGTSTAGEAPGGFTTKERKVAFARLMNSIPKIMFSRTLQESSWGPAVVMREVRAEEIESLKGGPGKDLVLFAGADIASAFMNQDLIDEYRLMIHPILLGAGIPLFRGQQERHSLSFKEAKPFASGVVLLRYERDRSS